MRGIMVPVFMPVQNFLAVSVGTELNQYQWFQLYQGEGLEEVARMGRQTFVTSKAGSAHQSSYISSFGLCNGVL